MVLSFRHIAATCAIFVLLVALFDASSYKDQVGSFREEKAVGELGLVVPPSATAGRRKFFLSGQYQDYAGLGHSFMAFHAMVAFSSRHNLTPHFSFACRGHNLERQKVKAYFFGDLIQARNNVTNCETIATSQDTFETDMAAYKLSWEEGAQTETNSSSSVNQEACTMFILQDVFAPHDSWGLDSHLPYYRALFESNDMSRQSVVKRKVPFTGITIVVHIRRGDLFGYLATKKDDKQAQQQAKGRLVPLAAYKSAVENVLVKLRVHGYVNVRIETFCETRDGENIIDVDGTFVDFASSILYDKSVQNVTFGQGSSDTIQAFDDMCFSDILITGASGFSYLSSTLCAKPLVLAVPFWHPYAFIPNAMEVEVTRTNFTLPNIASNFTVPLIARIDINDTQFDNLWQTRKAAEQQD